MKKVYLLGSLATFIFVTVQNIRWYIKCRRDGEIRDNTEITIGLVTFQLLGLLFSLTWFVSLPAYLVSTNNEKRGLMQQEG